MEKNFEKIDVRNQINRNSYFYDNKIQYFKGQNYLALKNECLKNGRLFTDPQFQPSQSSLYYSKSMPHQIKWLRPHEMVENPEFIVNKVEAHDLDQGFLGNCWFIAGCAAITSMPELFSKVVPQSQSFAKNEYCGIFHFRFWIYGFWYDVVVDDYLPVWDHNKKMAFCSNKEEPNEFWAALLEKAYAKVCGNYENLEGGFTSDALIDLTGGIQESFSLHSIKTEKDRENIWHIIAKSSDRKSMAAAYLDPNPAIYEERLPNGLIKGHAYTISQKSIVNVQNRTVRLLRLRNPWGRIEWKGAWSDHSAEWNQVPESLKNSLEFKIANEGEFWMCFEDFCRSFDSVQFCHMTPEAFSDEILLKTDATNLKIGWKMIAYHDEWSSAKQTAGGSGNGGDRRFWLNPQFLVRLVDVDADDDDDLATMIVALMQKYTREKRTQRNGEMTEEFIQFRVYRVLNELDAENATRDGEKLADEQLKSVGDSGDYINKREVTARFKLTPGYYLIIPSTFEAGCEGEFMLRIFTESLIESRHSVVLHRHDSIVSRLLPNNKHIDSLPNGPPPPLPSKPDVRTWMHTVGHRAVDKACDAVDKAVEKVDRAKETMRGHSGGGGGSGGGVKTHAHAVFSKLRPDYADGDVDDDDNIGEQPVTSPPHSSKQHEFKKQMLTFKRNLKPPQACSLM